MVSQETKDDVFADWLTGLNYRDLNAKHDIALATISGIISERKKKTPDLEALRKFKVKLESRGNNIHDLMRALQITEKLEEIGIGAATLEDFVEMVQKSTPEDLTSPEFVTNIIQLRSLEKKMGITPETILVRLEEAAKQLKERNQGLLTLQRQIQRLKDRKEASEFLEWMQNCGICYSDLIDHAVCVEDLEKERKILEKEKLALVKDLSLIKRIHKVAFRSFRHY